MCVVGGKRLTISLVLVAFILLTPVSLTAQTATAPTNDWSRLSATESGSKLVVKLKNGKTVEGKLSGVSDAVLSLSVKNKPVEIKRDDVRSVHQVKKKSAAKLTLIGLGVGAGAGAALGAAADDNEFLISRGQAAAGFAVLGAGVGAVVGYLVGRSGRQRVLIYETRQP
jgi:small nuclear ribonucleoprotein (snRNP)-like protein